jgi:hypothetical protein
MPFPAFALGICGHLSLHDDRIFGTNSAITAGLSAVFGFGDSAWPGERRDTSTPALGRRLKALFASRRCEKMARTIALSEGKVALEREIAKPVGAKLGRGRRIT